MSYLRYLCLLAYSSVQHILCFFLFVCVRLVCPMLLLVEQELLTLPEHILSPPLFSGVRVARSLVLYVCYVDRC